MQSKSKQQTYFVYFFIKVLNDHLQNKSQKRFHLTSESIRNKKAIYQWKSISYPCSLKVNELRLTRDCQDISETLKDAST